eukprot:m.169759 g.169759  ORF g.169759 m.169759 type:complete len:50 (+) comp24173_c0_seq1:3974-4123(+)
MKICDSECPEMNQSHRRFLIYDGRREILLKCEKGGDCRPQGRTQLNKKE